MRLLPAELVLIVTVLEVDVTDRVANVPAPVASFVASEVGSTIGGEAYFRAERLVASGRLENVTFGRAILPTTPAADIPRFVRLG